MERVRITGLPDDPLDAAAAFHADWTSRLRAAEADLLLAFPAADHTHRGWRLAALQMLARAIIPRRINAVSGGSDTAIGAAADYLARAPGLTGQLISLDDEGAGAVLPPPS
ncbi:MAG: hypothetical protein O9283_12040 [Sphingomonadaceae bacterium]|jgi:hypothetical protein|nr:hypothetical protein [Sphingomonadaceae bacterium]